ncbi:hypothetical protein [Amycolatopsis sp. cmx-4-68]|uniref:hypothetical protein n=1 Tax=Amycolatopsis sp. cmx-4-68 TaxID=2790938 RepID=UPI003977E9EE
MDGKVLVAPFRPPQRSGEAAAYLDWFGRAGRTTVKHAECVNGGEGDFLFAGEEFLSATGCRSDRRARDEVRAFFGRLVLSLTLLVPASTISTLRSPCSHDRPSGSRLSRGCTTIGVELAELLKVGGVKCCTPELRD